MFYFWKGLMDENQENGDKKAASLPPKNKKKKCHITPSLCTDW